MESKEIDIKVQVTLKKDFDTGSYSPGANKFKIAIWHLTSLIFFQSKLVPSSSLLVSILRLFGAKIGRDVRIKPGLYVKFPWKLSIGDYSWVADSYIENLDFVFIEKNCCISQKAMLITGNHNFKSDNFDLITKPIHLKEGSWVGAGAMVCPGVVLESHAVLTVGSVATKSLKPHTINQGNPAKEIRKRVR